MFDRVDLGLTMLQGGAARYVDHVVDVGYNPGLPFQVSTHEPDPGVGRGRFEGHGTGITGMEADAGERYLSLDCPLFLVHKLRSGNRLAGV